MTDPDTDVATEERGQLVASEKGGVATRPVDQVPATAGVHEHPDPRQYVLIAVVLVIATAIEVGLYYLEGDVDNNLLIGLLTVLAVAKFFLVAAWYMHMKVDPPFFRRIFLVGIIGAIIVYGAVMLTFASTLLTN